MSSFCICKSYSHFFSKNTCEIDVVLTSTVNILTINELVKLTMLWTTGPWMFYFAYAHSLTPFHSCLKITNTFFHTFSLSNFFMHLFHKTFGWMTMQNQIRLLLSVCTVCISHFVLTSSGAVISGSVLYAYPICTHFFRSNHICACAVRHFVLL